MKPHQFRPAQQRGLTLVECATAMAIAAVVIGTAAPSFESMRERRHLEGAAAQFETDLHLARSAAVARNQVLHLSFDAPHACYVVHTGGAGDCRCDASGAPVCREGAEPLRTAAVDRAAPYTLSANVGSMALEGQFGTVTPTATVRFVGRSGTTLHQVVNVMGRVRSCAATTGLPGYKPC